MISCIKMLALLFVVAVVLILTGSHVLASLAMFIMLAGGAMVCGDLIITGGRYTEDVWDSIVCLFEEVKAKL